MALTIQSTSEYKPLSPEETLKFLETSAEGLSESEARNRLKQFGFNEIVEKKRNLFLEFLRRYWGPMPWLLELAMLLSFLLKHDLEGAIIFVLLTVNAIIGHIHSRGSQKAVELLKNKLAIQAKVLRDGAWGLKAAREIVAGDIILVKLGDIIPADCKILSGELSVDESALTGESLPVDGLPSQVIHSGSIVKGGEARCVAVNIGGNTFFGKTVELVKIAKPKSHQEEVMMAVVKYMMYLGIGASLLIAFYALLIKVNILLVLTFITIFLMGAVPVALPAVLTIVQAVGSMELSRKGALVTRLSSMEDAASIDVLCLDKTGTITQNKLSVTDAIPLLKYKKEDVVRIAALASKAEGMDLIDLAVIEYAKGMGIMPDAYRQTSYAPFDPSTKRTEAIIESGGKRFKAMKGAPQIIISMCRSLDQKTQEKTNHTNEEYSKKGYRMIAVARSESDDLEAIGFVGFLPLSDPPRPDSRGTIEEARNLGIKSLMLTGDNLAIAKEIASQVGIGSDIITMEDIEGLNDSEQGR